MIGFAGSKSAFLFMLNLLLNLCLTSPIVVFSSSNLNFAESRYRHLGRQIFVFRKSSFSSFPINAEIIHVCDYFPKQKQIFCQKFEMVSGFGENFKLDFVDKWNLASN
jgi:hypothetical protein